MSNSINALAALELIESRQTLGKLVAPAPSEAEIEQVIRAALSAPDHRRIRPWQFMQLRDDARNALGQIFSECLTESGIDDVGQHAKVRAQPLRAPLIIIAVVKTQTGVSVPIVEQILSMGAAIQNALLMLNAQGYGSIWRSGTLAESPILKQKLGLSVEDEIAGFIYIGTPAKQLPPRVPLQVSDFLSNWPA